MAVSFAFRRQLGGLRVRVRRMLASPGQRARVNAGLGRGVWTLDRALVRGPRGLDVAGWAAIPDDPDIDLTVDGARIAPGTLRVPRPDLAERFPFLTERSVFGFHASLEKPSRGSIELNVVRQDGLPLGPHRGVFLQVGDQADTWPVPPPAQMARVHGSTDEASFRLVGFSTAKRLDAVLQQYFGRPLISCAAILDWGCGCGRLLRHLPVDGAVRLTGADIDPDNLGWSRTHLPVADYVHLDLLPPSVLAAGAFDTVIGISVFTHLTESAQLRWLEELQRVCRPGAAVLVTIHGPAAQAMTGDPVLSDQVERHGFVDARSADLDAIQPGSDYYRTSHHSHGYVRATWSTFFDVVEIIPACIAGVQDLVVLRKREGDALPRAVVLRKREE